jgi:amidophosphoribosyltransferase
MKEVKGAYSLVILAKDRLFAVRDPLGFRPLVLGKRGSAHFVASETTALDLVDAEVIREINPGEIIEIDEAGFKSHQTNIGNHKRSAFCSFEPIYFARPDSRIFNEKLYEVRKNLGRELSKEIPTEADVVIAVPDSGVPMAMGYAAASGIPYEIGLVRNHYVGRTFIEPIQSIRDFGVKLKLNPVESVLKDKRVVVVDDSLVRGTTSVKILRMIRSAGAKEIHMRIASPPITHSCYYGVDTPGRANLLAAQKSVEQIRQFIGADSLAYLSREGLKKALNDEAGKKYCYACFDGNYLEDICAKIEPQPTDGKTIGLHSQC